MEVGAKLDNEKQETISTTVSTSVTEENNKNGTGSYKTHWIIRRIDITLGVSILVTLLVGLVEAAKSWQHLEDSIDVEVTLRKREDEFITERINFISQYFTNREDRLQQQIDVIENKEISEFHYPAPLSIPDLMSPVPLPYFSLPVPPIPPNVIPKKDDGKTSGK